VPWVVVMHDDELGTDSKLFHSNFLQHFGKVKKIKKNLTCKVYIVATESYQLS
jgi:hypothetical protein